MKYKAEGLVHTGASCCRTHLEFSGTRGAARKLQIINYLTKIRVGKITTLKMVKQLSLSDLQVAQRPLSIYSTWASRI